MTHANLLAEMVYEACGRADKAIRQKAPEGDDGRLERLSRIEALASAAIDAFGDRARIAVSIEDYELFEPWHHR